ncbi:hypothetical protein BLX41_12555 [Pseudomonas protegens]|uniref:hypothetical protein n=1 Tax=Pseudomonas protegens TaxID=380021 RepID=UPI000F4C3334|nr:hypothetical protein [Pseudomonas protegens]ROL77627.1 hypothetical protein BLX41_12555 [Pseudomonas protegens]
MHKTLLIASLLLYGGAAHAADPVEVLGHGFGSLSCVDLQDPDSKVTCGARAWSNGKGCQGLSSQGMRDKCLDEALYPQSRSTRSRTARAKPPAPAAQVAVRHAMEPPAPLLSEREAKRLEEVLGVNGSRR